MCPLAFEAGVIRGDAVDLRIGQAFGNLVHHRGWARAVFERFELQHHVVLGYARQSWDGRAFGASTVCAVAAGASGGCSALVQTVCRLLRVRIRPKTRKNSGNYCPAVSQRKALCHGELQLA
jgi:hypothetical protein